MAAPDDAAPTAQSSLDNVIDSMVALGALGALGAKRQNGEPKQHHGGPRRASWLDAKGLLADNYGYAPDTIIKQRDAPATTSPTKHLRSLCDSAASAKSQLSAVQRAHQVEAAPNGERTVWMYWESADGAEMPPLVRRCIASARRHATVTLLDAQSILRFVTPVRGVERLAHISQRADYYRALLLFAHGGIWLDAASVVCRDLEPLFEALHGSSASLALEYKRLTSVTHGVYVAECSVKSLVARKRSPGKSSPDSQPHCRVHWCSAPPPSAHLRTDDETNANETLRHN